MKPKAFTAKILSRKFVTYRDCIITIQINDYFNYLFISSCDYIHNVNGLDKQKHKEAVENLIDVCLDGYDIKKSDSFKYQY